MHFSRLFALVATLSLATIVLAGPIHRRSFEDDSTDLLERELVADSEFDLAIRAPLTPAQRGAAAAQAIRKQNNRKDAKKAKVASRPPSKAARTAKWAAAKGTSRKPAKTAARAAGKVKAPKPSRAPRASKALKRQDRAAVKTHLRAAGAQTRNMANKPGRKDTFTHGTGANRITRTGKDVRKAIFNSRVHNGAPVGGNPAFNVKGNPKHFGNYPYSAGPVNGKSKPFPGTPSGSRSGLKEYPVTSNKAGWQGDRRPPKGPARIVHSNNRFQGVVTHDQANNHVTMTHNPAPAAQDWANNL
jgi:hypothetical protein